MAKLCKCIRPMKKYDIFISYSRKDSDLAERVVSVFDAYKSHYDFEYFFDRADITSRQEYLARIADAIYESKAMIFLASKNSYESEFCSKEILFADKYKVKTHIYCIDKATPPRKIELLLIDQHFLELSLCSIEKMVQQVLADVLGVDIKSLSELSGTEKQEESAKEIVTTEEPAHTGSNVKLKDVLSLANPIVGMVRAGVEVCKAVKEDANKQKVTNTSAAKTYKVGDYYDDGFKQGVVFQVRDKGRHGKIVSLDQAVLEWCTDAQYKKEIFVGADSEGDGKANTDKVMARSDADQYPAFVWCRNKGKDWYLPAVSELEELFKAKEAVNERHNLGYGVKLKRNFFMSYVSSSEKSKTELWGFTMGGLTSRSFKRNYNYVRAVSAF